MKNYVLNTFLIISLGTISLFISCADPCKDVNCGTYGTCNEGACDCESGYSGDNCDQTFNTKFSGTYRLVDSTVFSGPPPDTIFSFADTVAITTFLNDPMRFTLPTTGYGDIAVTVQSDGINFTIPFTYYFLPNCPTCYCFGAGLYNAATHGIRVNLNVYSGPLSWLEIINYYRM